MVRFTGGFALFTALASATSPDHRSSSGAQKVLGIAPVSQGNPRRLKGRILHITDFHPDPFYTIGADPEGEHPCHKGKNEGEATVGYYGAAKTDCDSPFALVNATFRWIDKHIKDEIDFVVWTGDSARHDNDDDYPRSTKQVEILNEYIVSKFVETFGKDDNVHDPDPTNDYVVPIVPTYGNNDILPHNIFEPGPNRWTKRYLDIWESFVPEEQRHSFARGGWFFTEVIPNKLAVFSLNTLYFFSSNAAVDGCDLKTEPGYEHMEWLRIQLQFMRERNMKAILIGHVPPARTESKQNWDETCYQKYTLWQHQYRDVIVANIFGHMNIDHFMFQDVRDLTYKFKIDGIDDRDPRAREHTPDPAGNGDFHAVAKATYINELRDGWATLPEPPKGLRYSGFEESSTKSGKERKRFLRDIGGEWAERFTMSLVSPSVVPNFFPTLRIIEYNVTGLEHDHPAEGRPQGVPAEQTSNSHRLIPNLPSSSVIKEAEVNGEDIEPIDDAISAEIDIEKTKRRRKGRKKKPTKPDFPVPRPPSQASPPGPAHSPQTFSFMSWTQFYANLTEIHAQMSMTVGKNRQLSQHFAKDQLALATEVEPQWLRDVRAKFASNKDESDIDKFFRFQVEYTTNNDSVYRLKDLTVRSWLDLAERIGRKDYRRPRSELDQAADGNKVTASSSDTLTANPRHLGEMEDNEDADVQRDPAISRKKKKKGKKHKDSGTGRLKKNRLWHTFVKRCFVQTKSEKDLEDDFD